MLLGEGIAEGELHKYPNTKENKLLTDNSEWQI